MQGGFVTEDVESFHRQNYSRNNEENRHCLLTISKCGLTLKATVVCSWP